MKLSELAFDCVKAVKYLDDPAFNYRDFVLGTFDSDPDYSNAINNVFGPINEAINRLIDRNKVQDRVEPLPNGDVHGIVSLDPLHYPVRSITSVFSIENGGIRKAPYRECGVGKIALLSPRWSSLGLLIEYKEDIQRFSRADFRYVEDPDDATSWHIAIDVDLRSKGITDAMCSYISEYAKGCLLEQIAPELANLHITRAEQYFSDLEDGQIPFEQTSVRREVSI